MKLHENENWVKQGHTPVQTQALTSTDRSSIAVILTLSNFSARTRGGDDVQQRSPNNKPRVWKLSAELNGKQSIKIHN